MKRALVFQHMDYDHPGRFLDFFSEDGIVPEMVRLWEGQEIPNLAPYDFLFVLGGAQDTWQEEHTWMPAEKAAIREWVWDRAKPYFTGSSTRDLALHCLASFMPQAMKLPALLTQTRSSERRACLVALPHCTDNISAVKATFVFTKSVTNCSGVTMTGACGER